MNEKKMLIDATAPDFLLDVFLKSSEMRVALDIAFEMVIAHRNLEAVPEVRRDFSVYIDDNYDALCDLPRTAEAFTVYVEANPLSADKRDVNLASPEHLLNNEDDSEVV